jgi:GntR family transcriptional regulator
MANDDGRQFHGGLSEENDTPLYSQLILLLKRQIHSGILKPGDLIPSENQLCAEYRVSRSTVRQALNQLTEEGLLLRRRGKGTFVASEKLNRNINHLYSFSEDMLASGRNPRSVILEKAVMLPGAAIADALGLPENGEVFKLTRLRLADEEPLLLETTYLPLQLCPTIFNEDLGVHSLYALLRSRYHLNLYRAVETYEAVKLTKEAAQLLRCKAQAPAFNIHRLAYLDSGIAFEYTSSVARSDKCRFRVELFSNKDKVNFSRQLRVE